MSKSQEVIQEIHKQLVIVYDKCMARDTFKVEDEKNLEELLALTKELLRVLAVYTLEVGKIRTKLGNTYNDARKARGKKGGTSPGKSIPVTEITEL